MNKETKTENKAVETKVSFDKKAFYQQMAKAFAKSKAVDVVADTDLGEKSTNKPEYEYIHFYKKDTEKNMFQCYVKGEGVNFVIGIRLKDFLKQGENYTIVPIEKTRNGEKKLVCIRVTCSHEDAIAVAETIIGAYESRAIETVEVPEKKPTVKKEPAAKKASIKKSKTA